MTREQAEQLRKLLENQTASMTDEQILKYPDFVEKWQSGKEYVVGKRLEYNGTIYKVLTAHTSQDTWTPPDAPSGSLVCMDGKRCKGTRQSER